MQYVSGRSLAMGLVLGLFAGQAWAAGESGGSGAGANGMIFTNPQPAQDQPRAQQGQKPQAGKKATRATPVCDVGFVMRKGGCVRVRADVLPDDELYEQGRVLARAGFHAHALVILEAIQDTSTARVWTMRGYATRKQGRIAEGMALYEKALAIDPDNVDTHEYKGEAFVTMGALDKAFAELAIVERLCGRTCEQYEDLAQVIATGQDEDD